MLAFSNPNFFWGIAAIALPGGAAEEPGDLCATLPRIGPFWHPCLFGGVLRHPVQEALLLQPFTLFTLFQDRDSCRTKATAKSLARSHLIWRHR